jgi:hypothetical protein
VDHASPEVPASRIKSQAREKSKDRWGRRSAWDEWDA